MNARTKQVNSITITERGLDVAGDINFPKFVQMMSSAFLAVMKKTRQDLVSNVPHDKADYAQVEGDIYDAVNLAMSNVLAMFAPELDKRPDLTEEAIKCVMMVEDDIIRRAAAGDIEAARIVTGNPNLQEEDLQCTESSTSAQDAEQN